MSEIPFKAHRDTELTAKMRTIMSSGRGEHQDCGSLALTGAHCCWNQSGDKNACPDGLSQSFCAGWNALQDMAKEATQHIPESRVK